MSAKTMALAIDLTMVFQIVLDECAGPDMAFIQFQAVWRSFRANGESRTGE